MNSAKANVIGCNDSHMTFVNTMRSQSLARALARLAISQAQPGPLFRRPQQLG